MKYIVIFSLIILGSSFAIAESEPLKIGLSLPLSGALAEYGTAVKNAFKMAEVDVGKGDTELLYEDNKFDGKTAVGVFNLLADVKKVDLIYLWGEPCLYAVSPLTSNKKIPVLSMSVDKRPAKNSPYVIRTVNPAQDFIKVVYQYLRGEKYANGEFKKIGILMADDPYFESLYEELVKQKLENEEVKLIANVSPEKVDFKSELLKVKSNKPDVLAMYLNPGQVSSAFRGLKNLGLNIIATIGTDIYESKTEVKLSKNTMIGARYHNLIIPEEFHARYLKEFGNDVQVSYAYNAYVTAKFLFENVEQLNLLRSNGGNLRDELIRLASIDNQRSFIFKNESDYGYYFSFPIGIKEVRKDGFYAVKK